MSSGDPVLRARGITKTFHDGDVDTVVLRGVDVELGAAELVALVGASGSGKSTLLSILGTLQHPSDGTLEIGGQEVTRLDRRGLDQLRNRTIGFVFQFHHLLPDFTALENAALPTWPRDGHESRLGRERARELLERVGLGDRLNYLATKLSGGQKQRVAIARALVNNPLVVFADEPTGNLDVDTSLEVMGLVREICHEHRTAFLVCTHDMDIAAACDRIIRLDHGRVSAEAG
jgi:lipoprotein-releasing system ATP-binding protein